MDKFIIMIISVISLVLIFSFFSIEENDSESLIGYADNIQEKNTGFVFDIIVENNMTIRAYSNVKPDLSLHRFSGNFSDDKTIFFVNEMADV